MAEEKEFTIAMRGASAAIFRQNEELVIDNLPLGGASAKITYRTRWIKSSKNIPLPGHLWIEVKGTGDNLEESLLPFANAGLAPLSILSLSANAAIGSPKLELAFESTPNIDKRDYFQSYVPPESDVVHLARLINTEATVVLLGAISGHTEFDRLLRAANQYRLALDSWKLGQQALSLAHLWMALEALTKARIRVELLTRGLDTEQKLADSLGVDLEHLDPTVRRDLILNCDRDCYKKAKEASDGFKHGFLGYDRIRTLAEEIRYPMAQHIRAAIFELSGLDEETSKVLMAIPFDKPIGYWHIVKYLRGHLVGDNKELAKEGNRYPFIRMKSEVEKLGIRQDGIMNLKFTEDFALELNKEIEFERKSFEVWKPE